MKTSAGIFCEIFRTLTSGAWERGKRRNVEGLSSPLRCAISSPLSFGTDLVLRPFAAFMVALCAFSVISGCGPSRKELLSGPHTVTASWYGSEFQGRPTASGERFDMRELTCAHREFSFGMRLLVTNMSNSRTVICTVNDRGPFVPGRDLDLSYAAAREIDLVATGVSQVKIEPLDRDLRYVRDVSMASSARGPYTVQVGSFLERDNAERLKAGLEFKYRHVYMTETLIDNRLYHRVRIGKYLKREDALKFGKALAEEGYGVFITRYEERT